MNASAAGYSGTPLLKKLGYRDGQRSVLADTLPRLDAAIEPDGTIWISWPKKAAKVPTDMIEDAVRAEALPRGLVDVKVCAVDAVWSGLKLVVRKELRAARR